MGRPYQSEIGKFPSTIEWALTRDTKALRHTLLRELGGYNLIAVGSGGSLVAAAFAALLHEELTGRMARIATPLETITRPTPRDTAALLLSARGSNVDIQQAAKLLPELGYEAVSAISTREGSPLGRILTEYGATMHEFTVPTGRDGFLATNSLLATLILLYKATSTSSSSVQDRTLVIPDPHIEGSEAILHKRTLFVLSQGWATPAAIDFESRFSEAALANVSVTDPRNFAHGRHNWLSLHETETGIVSLETKDSEIEASRMLRHLPQGIDVLRIKSAQSGPAATIELVSAVMKFAGQVGEARGIDPGRPSVADFGRRLYRAGATRGKRHIEATPIAKKRQALFLRPGSNCEEIEGALCEFIQRLEQTSFSGLAIDYDGTLCARSRRFAPLDNDMKDELNRLLEEGAILGIASGRGRSLYKQLRDALDSRYWNRVVAGMYNGAKVIELSDELPDSIDETSHSLPIALSRMRTLEGILGFKMQARPHQLSLRPVSGPGPRELRTVTLEQLADLEDVVVVSSSHAVDIVRVGTSKMAVIDAVLSKRRGCVLRVGDQGGVGGNDFDLLNTGLSLSVDRVSSNLETCWNLGLPGVAGPSLTLRYLQAIRGGPESFQVDTSRLV